MGKHAGQPANEPGKDIIWQEDAKIEDKVANFDAYDKFATGNAKDNNPYSKDNFNK